jgi:hypothetical protein
MRSAMPFLAKRRNKMGLALLISELQKSPDDVLDARELLSHHQVIVPQTSFNSRPTE